MLRRGQVSHISILHNESGRMLRRGQVSHISILRNEPGRMLICET
jgi:hypothetical protein